jgi:hypothetical protein
MAGCCPTVMSDVLSEVAGRLANELCATDLHSSDEAFTADPMRVEIYARNFEFSARLHRAISQRETVGDAITRYEADARRFREQGHID